MLFDESANQRVLSLAYRVSTFKVESSSLNDTTTQTGNTSKKQSAAAARIHLRSISLNAYWLDVSS
jgi:hypothetical protein